jgi:hypothetical protein
VAALVAAARFGASLTRLLVTPELYGSDFSIGTLGGGFIVPAGVDMQHLVEADVATLPGVDQITLGGGSASTIGTTPAGLLFVTSLRGPLALTIVSGRAPAARNEVVVGATTLRRLHARIGSSLSVNPSGGATGTVTVKVVGEAALPASFDGGTGGLGNGAAFLQGDCAGCLAGDPILYVGFTHNPAGRAGLARLNAEARDPSSPLYFLDLAMPVPPTSLVNFGQAVNFPLLLSVLIVVFAAASLTHVLVVSVTRCRREVGVLKAIGFVRRQAGAVVAWQSATVVIVALVVGIPIGVAIGRGAWGLFASSLGVANDTVIPWWRLAEIAAGALLAAELIAAFPAMASARLRPADVLREG